MVRGTIFSRARKQKGELWSRTIFLRARKQKGELWSGDTNSLGSSKGPGDLLKREIKADASQLTLLRVREVTVSAGHLEIGK